MRATLVLVQMPPLLSFFVYVATSRAAELGCGRSAVPLWIVCNDRPVSLPIFLRPLDCRCRNEGYPSRDHPAIIPLRKRALLFEARLNVGHISFVRAEIRARSFL